MPPQGRGGSLAVQGRLCWLWGASPAELHISQMRKLTFQNLKPGPDLTTSMLYRNSSVGQQHEGLQTLMGNAGGRAGVVAQWPSPTSGHLLPVLGCPGSSLGSALHSSSLLVHTLEGRSDGSKV